MNSTARKVLYWVLAVPGFLVGFAVGRVVYFYLAAYGVVDAGGGFATYRFFTSLILGSLGAMLFLPIWPKPTAPQPAESKEI